MDALEAWLRLVHAPGVGPVRTRALLAGYGDATAAVRAPPQRLRAAGLGDDAIRALRAAEPPAGVVGDREWAEAGTDRHLLALDDPRYPRALAGLADAPPVLYVQGDPDALATPALAVVGSRHPTPSGRETAYALARHLAARGLTIVSGLALGIDAAAHEGALAGGGPTVGVAGTGLDRVYPARHAALAHRVAAEGALVSELPIGTRPSREGFPRRNRLLAALAAGTLVVEAAVHSGSLITARLALEQGREVFAVPGSIHNPVARGCHRLIRAGAKLVETGDDVLEELAPQLGDWLRPAGTEAGADAEPAAAAAGRDPEYARLLACVDWRPRGVDELASASGLEAAAVASMLLQLELEGAVRAIPGGLYQRP